jgi:exopolysaccharide biosynthesis polyprenyl glycosylphosphotransferase
MFATNAELGTIAGLPIVEIRRTPLDGWGRIVKRLFDLVGATIGLILLSPVFAVVAIAIKLTDPGPVFYRHKRLSRNGEAVGVLKFRTMKAGYSTGPGHKYKTAEDVLKALGREDLIPEFQENQKLEDDPRVSKIGNFLRRTSLDELPQLVNAFMGELSLVGPRPIIAAELERYGEQSASFLSLKPGITGLWQVSGRSDTSYEERVKLDIYYVENWSLLLDIQILLKTVAYVIRGKGAY